MSTRNDEIPLSKRVLVYGIPGMENIEVRQDIAYRTTDDGPLTMDVYYPPSGSRAPVPAAIFVIGYPDAGFRKHLGCCAKEMALSKSWGQVVAASGIAAITYTNREPVEDTLALIQYVRDNAAALGIAGDRIGLWAGSGNSPLALFVLMQGAKDFLRCAVLDCPCTLDIDGSTGIAEASKTYGFVNPCAGKSVDDLPDNIPLFIARAGQDQVPHLNEALDRFIAKALANNLPLTFANHATAPHAFEIFDDSPSSRELIRQMLGFMKFNLGSI